MNKRIIILGIATCVIFSLSFCLKRGCECEAVGYASQGQLQEVLNRYERKGCLRVVEEGGYTVDYTGIELYCYEE